VTQRNDEFLSNHGEHAQNQIVRPCHASALTMSLLKAHSPSMLQTEVMDQFGHHSIFQQVRYIFVGQPFSATPLFPGANPRFHFYLFFTFLLNIDFNLTIVFYLQPVEL
jgi:hypothetical protein